MRLAGLLICMLAACGGGGGSSGGGSSGGVDPRLARLDVYAAQNLRVLGDPSLGVPAMPLMPDASLPEGGTVAFNGSAAIRVEIPAAPLVLAGDATVTLDFDMGLTGGSVTNVFGETITGTVADYTGQIALTGGMPGADLNVSYAGTLEGGGTTLVFGGALAGHLLGDPLGALAIADLEAAIDADGTTQSGTMIIVAEKVTPPQPPDPPPPGAP